MGRNVFVSYKYGDDNVRQFERSRYKTSSRDYVNMVECILQKTYDFHYRGERDGDDMTGFPKGVIRTELANRIFQTSLTIVLISAGMRQLDMREIDQWVPWEISYSMKYKYRGEVESHMNGILAVVIPDCRGNYSHALYESKDGSFRVKRQRLFRIISSNIFNKPGIQYETDDYGSFYYNWDDSYIVMTRWDDFCNHPVKWMDRAIAHRVNRNRYIVTKKIRPEWG